jgi:hypothetical protein
MSSARFGFLKGDNDEAERAYEGSIEVWDTLQAGRWNVPVIGLALARCRPGRASEGLAVSRQVRGQGSSSCRLTRR